MFRENDCGKCTKEDRINRAKLLCSKCDIEKIEDNNAIDGYLIRCNNKLLHFDDSYFKIEEVNVIE
jgi:tRNA splicing ligase